MQEGESRGLTTGEWPNDGSKTAKRWFKSHVARRLHKKQPLALGAEPTYCKVPREKRDQKTEDFIVYLYVQWI